MNIFLPFLSGILLFIAFPQKDFKSGFLAWLAFVPLLLSLQGCPKSKAFLKGWITAISFGSILGSHLWMSMRNFYEMPFLKAVLVIVFFIIFMGGLHFSIFCVFSRFFQGSRLWNPFLLAGIWTSLEFLYSRISLQARTIVLGYTQHHMSFFFPIARIGGVYAMSYFVMLINLIFTQWIKERRRLIKVFALVTVLFISAFLIDSLSLSYKQNGSLRISLLQSNLGHELRWSSSFYEKQVNCLLDMTKEASREKPDLIAWPSTALILQGKGALPEILRSVPKDARILLGARLYLPFPDGLKKFNSIILSTTTGEITDIYLKKILMPYGEYLPFKWLDIFGKKKFFPDEYTASKEDYTVFNINGFKFSTPICLEILYPELIHRFHKEGANIIFNFSNDNAYIDPWFPYYFLIVAKMRGIEFGIPVIRETVNGYSAIIDYNGRVLKSLNYGIKGILKYDFNLGYRPSFYARHGDIFSWTCVFLTILIITFKIYHMRAK